MEEPYGWYEHQRRGAFPGYLKQARKQGVSLEAAIMRATALPAQQFRLMDRGLITTGKIADLMVFDPERYSFPLPSESDPNDPFPMASGVTDVVVDGVPILLKGKLTGSKPGRVLV
jgi:N-acyl-D-amino-acid deacylase